jgi:NAD(P)-dependent dehydrogenase (short-subunit alcohol dehydrogenase family)
MLAGEGYNVAVHYNHSQAEARAVCDEAEAQGVRAEVFQADVTKPDEAAALVSQVHDTFGQLDVLINNVGNYHKVSLDELAIDDWHAMFDSNLHCTFYTCQTAVQLMRVQNFGRIINIGFAGSEKLVARPGVVAYGIAKTGVILYSKALAKTEAKHGITVNVISPGIMVNSKSKPTSNIPLGRLGELDELTSVAKFLVSEEARYVTGVHVEVAGGWNL